MSHETFAAFASDFLRVMCGLGIGCATQGVGFIERIMGLFGVQELFFLRQLGVLLASVIIFAHLLVRSSHSWLVQMTPP